MKKIIRLTESELKEIINDKLAQAYDGNPRSYPSGEQWTMGEEQENIDPELEKFYKESDVKIWFLENVVDKVKEITKPGYPDNIYYVDKNTDYKYMIYNEKNKILWVDYRTIWEYFESNYIDNLMEIRKLIEYLMLEYYNLKDITVFYYNLNASKLMLRKFNYKI